MTIECYGSSSPLLKLAEREYCFEIDCKPPTLKVLGFLQVVVDPSLPPDVIEFRDGGRLVGRITEVAP